MQVVKVMKTRRYTPEEVEEEIAVLWESMALPNGLKPGLRNLWALGDGKIALLFDYSLNGGATVLEPAPLCVGPAPEGGSLKDKPLYGYDDDNMNSPTCIHCGEDADAHGCPEVKGQAAVRVWGEPQ